MYFNELRFCLHAPRISFLFLGWGDIVRFETSAFNGPIFHLQDDSWINMQHCWNDNPKHPRFRDQKTANNQTNYGKPPKQ